MSAHGSRMSDVVEGDMVLAFVNTRPSGSGRPEMIGDASALAAWLSDHDFSARHVTEADAAQVRHVRESLVTLLAAHVGSSSPEKVSSAENHLRDVAAAAPLRASVHADHAFPAPAGAGLVGLFSELFAQIIRADAGGRWNRLKMCSNPPCGSAFEDRSRNSSGKYCTTTCSAQQSMRTYRAKHRTA